MKTTQSTVPFLYAVLNSDAFSMHLKQKATSSTGSRKRIDPENCVSFAFAYDSHVASEFSQKVSKLLECAVSIPEENHQLASLRDFLLPMLMNGQVKVENVSAS